VERLELQLDQMDEIAIDDNNNNNNHNNDFAEPLEEFFYEDRFWQVYETDEHFLYYLDMAHEHSQWEDPRVWGIITTNIDGTSYVGDAVSEGGEGGGGGGADDEDGLMTGGASGASGGGGGGYRIESKEDGTIIYPTTPSHSYLASTNSSEHPLLLLLSSSSIHSSPSKQSDHSHSQHSRPSPYHHHPPHHSQHQHHHPLNLPPLSPALRPGSSGSNRSHPSLSPRLLPTSPQTSPTNQQPISPSIRPPHSLARVLSWEMEDDHHHDASPQTALDQYPTPVTNHSSLSTNR
jgi:hypothetical protein